MFSYVVFVTHEVRMCAKRLDVLGKQDVFEGESRFGFETGRSAGNSTQESDGLAMGIQIGRRRSTAADGPYYYYKF